MSHSPSFLVPKRQMQPLPLLPRPGWWSQPWRCRGSKPPLCSSTRPRERRQASGRQDVLHQQRPWHSCRPGLLQCRGCVRLFGQTRGSGMCQLSAARASLSVVSGRGGRGCVVCVGVVVSVEAVATDVLMFYQRSERNSAYQSREEKKKSSLS